MRLISNRGVLCSTESCAESLTKAGRVTVVSRSVAAAGKTRTPARLLAFTFSPVTMTIPIMSPDVTGNDADHPNGLVCVSDESRSACIRLTAIRLSLLHEREFSLWVLGGKIAFGHAEWMNFLDGICDGVAR